MVTARADVAYLAENDQLRLSIRILNLPIEFGDFEETDDGDATRSPVSGPRSTGFSAICMSGCLPAFRIGEVSVTRFRT